jgi:signal transduction histidine kinase
LSHRIRKLAAGEFPAQVPVQRTDEIGILAQSFNQMAARIEEAQTLRQRQLAAIVHELARPLTGIRAAVETLADGAADDKEVAVELLTGIGEEIERLVRLLGPLQRLDQRIVHPLRLNQCEVNLANVIKASFAQYELVAQQAGSTLLSRIPTNLPLVYVDEDRVIQLLVNLLDNALKFTPPGGTIVLEVSAQDEFALICVADSGVGIGPDEMPHLFQQFYRGAESRPLEKRGMGLGLTICREIITAHGGKIWVESELNKGTRVLFTLPFAGPGSAPS